MVVGPRERLGPPRPAGRKAGRESRRSLRVPKGYGPVPSAAAFNAFAQIGRAGDKLADQEAGAPQHAAPLLQHPARVPPPVDGRPRVVIRTPG